MPVSPVAPPPAAVRLHRYSAVVVPLLLSLIPHARSGDAAPGLTDFKEPLSQYNVADLYAACRAMPLHRAGQSGDFEHLRLVPMTSSIDPPVGSWQANGKFVGVVENSGSTFNPQYNVDAAAAGNPGVTCAWFGFEQGTQQLMLRLVSPNSIKSINATRDQHDPPHTQPLAEWRTKTGLPVPTPGTPPDLVAEVAWWVCDPNGCCKGQ